MLLHSDTSPNTRHTSVLSYLGYGAIIHVGAICRALLYTLIGCHISMHVVTSEKFKKFLWLWINLRQPLQGSMYQLVSGRSVY